MTNKWHTYINTEWKDCAWGLNEMSEGNGGEVISFCKMSRQESKKTEEVINCQALKKEKAGRQSGSDCNKLDNNSNSSGGINSTALHSSENQPSLIFFIFFFFMPSFSSCQLGSRTTRVQNTADFWYIWLSVFGYQRGSRKVKWRWLWWW